MNQHAALCKYIPMLMWDLKVCYKTRALFCYPSVCAKSSEVADIFGCSSIYFCTYIYTKTQESSFLPGEHIWDGRQHVFGSAEYHYTNASANASGGWRGAIWIMECLG